MGAHHEVLEFLHAFRHFCCQVWVDVVVVFDGIRTSCNAFHHSGVVSLDAILRVITLGGMFDKSGVPNVGGTKFLDFSQSGACEISHFAATILLLRAIAHILIGIGSEKTGEDLVDDEFFHGLEDFGMIEVEEFEEVIEVREVIEVNDDTHWQNICRSLRA